jgi:hypothetical protein
MQQNQAMAKSDYKKGAAETDIYLGWSRRCGSRTKEETVVEDTVAGTNARMKDKWHRQRKQKEQAINQ